MGKDIFGDYFDVGFWVDFVFQVDLVVDGFVDFFVQFVGQLFGCCLCCQVLWFEYEDVLVGELGFVEQGQWYVGGFVGVWWGFQNGLVLCVKGLVQGGNNGVDGQGNYVGFGLIGEVYW